MRVSPRVLMLILASVAVVVGEAKADVLYDNTDAGSGGSLAIGADHWFAAMFTTGTEQGTMLTASLLLAEASPGTPSLELYSDDSGLVPGAPIATFNPPASIPAVEELVEFTLSGIELDPLSNYWIVFHGGDGEYDWSWRGAWEDYDVLQPWADSSDAGTLWFAGDAYTPIYNVTLSDSIIPGDINGDGVVSLLDVSPFVDLLNSGQYLAAGDLNGDGVVNLLDVAPFVALLSGN